MLMMTIIYGGGFLKIVCTFWYCLILCNEQALFLQNEKDFFFTKAQLHKNTVKEFLLKAKQDGSDT